MKYCLTLFLFTLNTAFGQKKITGFLLDSINPIQFAKVFLKNGKSATLSDINGYFELPCDVKYWIQKNESLKLKKKSKKNLC